MWSIFFFECLTFLSSHDCFDVKKKNKEEERGAVLNGNEVIFISIEHFSSYLDLLKRLIDNNGIS